jgi:hypothetical protein
MFDTKHTERRFWNCLGICRNMDLNIVVAIDLDMNFQMRNYGGLVNLMRYLLRCEKNVW